MIKHLAIGTLAILAVAVTLNGRAEAGASASAPSKNSHANQVASTQNQQATRNGFAITEYSSSSSRARSRCSTTAYC